MLGRSSGNVRYGRTASLYELLQIVSGSHRRTRGSSRAPIAFSRISSSKLPELARGASPGSLTRPDIGRSRGSRSDSITGSLLRNARNAVVAPASMPSLTTRRHRVAAKMIRTMSQRCFGCVSPAAGQNNHLFKLKGLRINIPTMIEGRPRFDTGPPSGTAAPNFLIRPKQSLRATSTLRRTLRILERRRSGTDAARG
jgi:hypothetical protein